MNIQKKEQLSNYKRALEFELSYRGTYKNLNYQPVFLASAIFFVISDQQINTKISFLNYWKIKNNNAIVL